MSSDEVNYTVTKKKALAIIFAVKKFRNYLLGKKFTVVTDHQALKYIVNKSNPSGRITRWIIFLLIKWRADAFSLSGIFQGKQSDDLRASGESGGY